jgi:hypothetical protein
VKLDNNTKVCRPNGTKAVTIVAVPSIEQPPVQAIGPYAAPVVDLDAARLSFLLLHQLSVSLPNQMSVLLLHQMLVLKLSQSRLSKN